MTVKHSVIYRDTFVSNTKGDKNDTGTGSCSQMQNELF